MNDPLVVRGPVGDVRLVFGRKKAKEACAELVWGFLRGLARERLVGLSMVGDGGKEGGEKGWGWELGI